MASNLRVDSIVPATGTNVSIGTAPGGVNIPGVVTYEDVSNVDSIGVITARSGINITGGRLLIGTTTAGEATADDLTIATSGSTGITIRSGTGNAGNIQFGDGTSGDDQLRGVVQYHHSDNSMRFMTNASERIRIGVNGEIGIGGGNYGNSGQVLTSQGSGAAVQWATPNSGDYVKIQRGTNGYVASYIFDNLDVATYKFFDFNAAFVPGDDGQYPYFRFRTGGASGADVTGSHYSYGYGEAYPSNNMTQGSQSGHSQVTLSGTLGYNTNNGEGLRISMRIMFADANDNGSSGQLSNFITYQYIRVDASGNPRFGHGSAIYNENTSTYPTGFRLYMASGGINANSYGLYGMKR